MQFNSTVPLVKNQKQMEIAESILPADRISNLPNGVSETILTYMPLRDAVRTSILSRKWRYVWTKLPQFVLDLTLWEYVDVLYSAEITLTKILYQLLLSQDGPIVKFTLSIPDLKRCPEIDNLILFLSKRQIEDLTIEMWKKCYSLPYSIISCQKLRHLRLKKCSIRNFPSIGFNLLVSLTLIEVTITAEALANLISGSPLLGMLEIQSTSEVTVSIDARNLKTIILSGSIKSVNFKRVPVLSSVSIMLFEDSTFNFVGQKRKVPKNFDCFLSLQTLQLSYQVVRSFQDEKLRILPTSLIHLIDLTLSDISFNDMTELSFTLYLLRSSPNLKYLEISILDSPDSNSDETILQMEGEDFSDICLRELIEVKLYSVTGTEPELEFIRLLLAKSPRLKTFEILPIEASVENGFKILKQVTQFRRMSNEAEIIYVE